MSWWYVLNVAKRWLYSFAEQTIVGALMVPLGSAAQPYRPALVLRDLTLVVSLAKPSFGSSRTAGKRAIILIDFGEKRRPAAQPQQPSDSALNG